MASRIGCLKEKYVIVGNYLRHSLVEPLSMIPPSKIINLLLHLTVQARHPDQKRISQIKAFFQRFQMFWDYKTGYLRPWSEIVVGQKLEKLKVAIRDVSLEPWLGNHLIVYEVITDFVIGQISRLPGLVQHQLVDQEGWMTYCDLECSTVNECLMPPVSLNHRVPHALILIFYKITKITCNLLQLSL